MVVVVVGGGGVGVVVVGVVVVAVAVAAVVQNDGNCGVHRFSIKADNYTESHKKY